MATYLYGCPECGSTKEVSHSIMEDPKIKCANCPSEMVRRPQKTGVAFKGEGFYTTDKFTDR